MEPEKIHVIRFHHAQAVLAVRENALRAAVLYRQPTHGSLCCPEASLAEENFSHRHLPGPAYPKSILSLKNKFEKKYLLCESFLV